MIYAGKGCVLSSLYRHIVCRRGGLGVVWSTESYGSHGRIEVAHIRNCVARLELTR